MPTSLKPRGHIEPDGILVEMGCFDLDQPTDYLGRIRPKGIAGKPSLKPWRKKKGASQRTPTPTENHREANASLVAILPGKNAKHVDPSQTLVTLSF